MRALVLAALALGACDPRPCPGRCDAHEVAAAFAGIGSTDCGVVAVDGDRTALDACVAMEFLAGRPFFGVVELRGPATAILVRGHARNARGELREVLGTRQDGRTVVHTRPCFEASTDASGQLRCTSSFDGLLVECDCTGPGDAGAVTPDGPG